MFLFFSFINTADAGIISFFEKIFGLNEKEIPQNENLATMPILEAPKNMNAGVSQLSRGLNIIDKNSLLANAGPIGTILNVDKIGESTEISLYTVRKGDTLSSIAEMFNVDTNTIRWANDIKKGETIKEGIQLVVLPISGINYTIKKGDTIKSVAKKFGSDEDEIIQFNDIDLKSEFAVGSEIIVPDGELAEEDSNLSNDVQFKKKATMPTPFYGGYFANPVYGAIKTQGIHGYNGVDLAASCGTPIYAAANGEVIISRSYGWNGGYGNYIAIKHPNGTQTLYAHNSLNKVFAGDYVKKGQLIGLTGTTGRSTGCHLHFEVRGARNPF